MRILKVIGLALTIGASGLALVYFGRQLGNNETKITANAAAIAHAQREHEALETRTDRKLVDQRELILSELRAINGRLDRIERKIP